MARKIYSEKLREKVRKLFREGKRATVISAITGVSYPTIRIWVGGTEARRDYRIKLSLDQVNLMKHMYFMNASIRSIADKFGVSKEYTRHLVKGYVKRKV